MNVLEFAESRLNDKNNKDYETRYWAAYIDGVKAQNNENAKSRKTIEDVMICPNCGSKNCYEFDIDDVDFSSDNEHYNTDCYCKDCGTNFRLCFNFTYTITKSIIR